jgi:DNA-binding transcriptional ArsR family regulator
METRRDVFQAIADPNRRAIINLLAHKKLSLNQITDNFDVSRPAISRHIKILIECGLVVVQKDGREHYCLAQLKKLSEVNEWVKQYSEFWSDRFDSLEEYLALEQKKAPKKKSNKKK